MNLSETTDENHVTMNLMILSKREETEKHITAEHNKLTTKFESRKLTRQDDLTTNNKLQEESTMLNHQNAILSSRINNYNYEIGKIQQELVIEECKIDKLKTNHTQARVVKDKENRTMNLLCNRMCCHRKILNKFWEYENDLDRIKNLEQKKKSFEAKRTKLQGNIEQMQEKIRERKKLIPKFNEEIMILKKRNAAYLKRMNRKLEFLEHSLSEKKKKIVNRNPF